MNPPSATMAERRAQARQYIAERRAATSCARCGAQPIDWHSDSHHSKPHRRIANMPAWGASIADIAAEIARCEPLCRRCHMETDGRLAAFVEQGSFRGTHCKAGHAYTEANTYVDPSGRRTCRECHRRLGREGQRRRRAQRKVTA